MAQPTSVRRAHCPECKRGLNIVERVPAEVGEMEGVKAGEVYSSKPVFRSLDQGAVLLWVWLENWKRFEEIMRNSAGVGTGPDGNANGLVECPTHGELDIDAVCGAYESEERCEHEKPMWEPWPEDLGWAGGIGVCECCKDWVFYVASASITFRDDYMVSAGQYPDMRLCLECGGSPMVFEYEKHKETGEIRVIRYEPGSYGPAEFDPDYAQAQPAFHKEATDGDVAVGERLVRDGET